MQKRFNWIPGIFFLILLAVFVVIYTFRVGEIKVVGTYSSGIAATNNDVYIAFFRNGEFLIYNQETNILTGDYIVEDVGENIIARMMSNGNAVYVSVFNKPQSILLIRTSPVAIYELEKISDTPMLIGHSFDASVGLVESGLKK